MAHCGGAAEMFSRQIVQQDFYVFILFVIKTADDTWDLQQKKQFVLQNEQQSLHIDIQAIVEKLKNKSII